MIATVDSDRNHGSSVQRVVPPECSLDILRKIFSSGLAGVTLGEMNVLEEGDASNVRGLLQRFVEDFEKRMNVSDPLESLLIEQALLTHHRVLILSREAAAASDVVHPNTTNMVAMLNQQCDQASNTFRRLILALAEYRQPRQTMFARNINAANQQIVNQDLRNAKKKKRRTN